MRTVLLTLLIAMFAGACSLYFDSHGSSSSGAPDASTTDDGQHDPLPDAFTDDAGHNIPDGGTNCGDDGGVLPDAAEIDAIWPIDASGPLPDAKW